MGAIEDIKEQQRRWAEARGISCDPSLRVRNLNDNFYQPLTHETEHELREGVGDEFGQPDKPGKIFSLYSSAALVVNVFDYWRSKNASAIIANLCGAEGEMTEMTFEKTHPTSLRGTPPHLDLEFKGGTARPLAIESKYTEPYSARKKTDLAKAYVEKPDLWSGIPKCGEVARMISGRAKKFVHLDAPQLLKHILGLTNSYGNNGFALLYLWYRAPGDEANEHEKEIDQFLRLLGGEVSLRATAYQELFQKIRNSGSAEPFYSAYLRARYFTVQSSCGAP